MTLKIELGVDSSTAIELNVKYASAFSKRQMRSEHRTKAGRLYIYRWNNYINHSFSVDFMTTANASIVNSWWETNTELLLFVTSDSTTEVTSVMITNPSKPLDRFIKPYNTYQKGRLRLESY